MIVLVPGSLSFPRAALASVHRQGPFSRCETSSPTLQCFEIDNTLPVSALELHQDIFIWRVQEMKEMNHRSHFDCHWRTLSVNVHIFLPDWNDFGQ
jgi:hypothetical protein